VSAAIQTAQDRALIAIRSTRAESREFELVVLKSEARDTTLILVNCHRSAIALISHHVVITEKLGHLLLKNANAEPHNLRNDAKSDFLSERDRMFACKLYWAWSGIVLGHLTKSGQLAGNVILAELPGLTEGHKMEGATYVFQS
jgi:hypothetical protein